MQRDGVQNQIHVLGGQIAWNMGQHIHDLKLGGKVMAEPFREILGNMVVFIADQKSPDLILSGGGVQHKPDVDTQQIDFFLNHRDVKLWYR